MVDRAYTVTEIDALRYACNWRISSGIMHSGSRPTFRVFAAGELEKRTEDQVRTYMLAGITADHIYAEDKKCRENEARQQADWQARQPKIDPAILNARLAAFDEDRAAFMRG